MRNTKGRDSMLAASSSSPSLFISTSIANLSLLFNDESPEKTLAKAPELIHTLVRNNEEAKANDLLLAIPHGTLAAVLDARDEFSMAPLHIAAQRGYLKIVKILLFFGAEVNSSDRNGWTPLHFASNEGHLSICEFLLKKGAMASLKTNNGSIGLHYIAQKAAIGFEDPYLYLQVVPLMFKQGADINSVNQQGETPLHLACFSGSKQSVLFFLKFEPDVNLKTKKGETPLHYATWGGKKDIVSFLLQMGADPTIPGPAGTPLEIAAKTNQKEIEESLRVFAGSETQRRSTLWKACRLPTSKVDLQKSEPDTRLHFSCAFEGQKLSLNQGTITIDRDRIVFLAHSTGHKETKISIPLVDILAINKSSSMLVMQDSIEIYTQYRKYFFTSFIAQQAVYAQIEEVWIRELMIKYSGIFPANVEFELKRFSNNLKEFDIYGFPNTNVRSQDKQLEFYSSFMSTWAQKESQWNLLLHSNQGAGFMENFREYVQLVPDEAELALKSLIKLGIPPTLRGELYYYMSGAHAKARLNKNYFASLVAREGPDSPASKQIEKDIKRTFPGHPYFESEEGQAALRRVLAAYSLRNPAVGYCQSMNFIAGMLLLLMNEERAFWVLCTIVEDSLQEYFSHAMTGTIVDQQIFTELVALHLPTLNDHFNNVGFPLSIFSIKWCMCLFLDSMPTECVLRVWDLFFYEGFESVLAVGLSILKGIEPQLLRLKESDAIREHIIWRQTNCFDSIDNIIETALTINPLFSQEKTLAQVRLQIWADVSSGFTIQQSNVRNIIHLRQETNFTLKELEKLYEYCDSTVVASKEKININSFKLIFNKILDDKSTVDHNVATRLFSLLDVTSDGILDTYEMMIGLDLLVQKDPKKRIELWYRLFDEKGDGCISPDQFQKMLKTVTMIYYRNDYNDEIARMFENSVLKPLPTIYEFKKALLDYDLLAHLSYPGCNKRLMKQKIEQNKKNDLLTKQRMLQENVELLQKRLRDIDMQREELNMLEAETVKALSATKADLSFFEQKNAEELAKLAL